MSDTNKPNPKLEPFSIKSASVPGAVVIGKDGHEYDYIAGPDRKGGVVLFIRSFDYFKILWDYQIDGVRLPK